MKSDKLQTQIEGQKMSKGGSTLDQSALLVPAIGIGLMLVLMAVFYIYYKRRQNRHQPARLAKVEQRAEKLSRSGRGRGRTLAEAGGLPPVRASSGKEAAS